MGRKKEIQPLHDVALASKGQGRVQTKAVGSFRERIMKTIG